MSSAWEHEQAVADFFAKAAAEQPEAHAAAVERHPVISRKQQRTIYQKEITVGLIGLEPVRIAAKVAEEFGVESIRGTTE